MSVTSPVTSLGELKLLLSRSIELNAHGREPQPYDPGDFSVARSVRLVEKDGLAMIVKYGTRVSGVEAESTNFVARHTSVRVPQIYAVFVEIEDTRSANNGRTTTPRIITYIVEERLPGRTLTEAWPSLTFLERNAVAGELKAIFAQISALVPGLSCLGPLRGPWNNAYFHPFKNRFPCGELDARTPHSFLAYFRTIASSTSAYPHARAPQHALPHVDLTRGAVFSHGALHPGHVLVTLDTPPRIAGVVDWSAAGWWPYFWDAFVLRGSVARLAGVLHGWGRVVPTLGEWCPEEAREFEALWDAALEAARV